MTDVPFPPLSKEQAAAEGVVSTWFVSEGESVRADQLLAEVQVDKVAAAEPVAMAPVVKSDWDKTPRNAPCPCGSGKKFKLCHGR